MRRILLSSVASLALPYFSLLCLKGYDFRGKSHWTQNICFAFPLHLSSETFLVLRKTDRDHHHHHHHHPWIRSFDVFRHRRIAIVSWGVHDFFFLEVCSWGPVSGVWCCPFFQGGWSSFVCIWVSRLVFERSLVLFLWLRFLFHPVLCIP